VAGRDPVPHLVDVPNDPNEDDRPVYLCAEHRAAYDDAFGQASNQPPGGPEGITAAMRSFLVGLSDDQYSTPSLGVQPPIRESIKGSTPRTPAPPSDHGGFDGRDADVFDHAFTVCYDVTWRAVTADPPGSGPSLYSAKRSVPLAAMGSVARDGDEAMRAVRAGCLVGQNSAFSDAGSHHRVCRQAHSCGGQRTHITAHPGGPGTAPKPCRAIRADLPVPNGDYRPLNVLVNTAAWPGSPA
jgi:hypothetical protein